MTPNLPPNLRTITRQPANRFQKNTREWAKEELRLMNLWDTYFRRTSPEREAIKAHCKKLGA